MFALYQNVWYRRYYLFMFKGTNHFRRWAWFYNFTYFQTITLLSFISRNIVLIHPPQWNQHPGNHHPPTSLPSSSKYYLSSPFSFPCDFPTRAIDTGYEGCQTTSRHRDTLAPARDLRRFLPDVTPRVCVKKAVMLMKRRASRGNRYF